jgi:2-deoxy-D-gluconate 3-dehydrogenase
MLSFQGGIFVPGYIVTENTRPIREDEKRNESILVRIPEARWGKPEDIAEPILFLASKDADYMNGTIMNVDGGWLAR